MRSRGKHQRAIWLIIGLAFVAWIALFVISTPGIRGSDQYWYAGEVRALIAGSDNTNSLWPFFLLNDASFIEDPPFIHRGWIPYIVAVPAGLVGHYTGWIVTNFLLSLAAAALIYRACRNLDIDKPVAALAGIVYLLFPVYLWTSTQPLAEAFVGLVFAALIAAATSRLPSLLKFLLMVVIILLGQQLQTIFMPALVGLLASWLAAEWLLSKRRSIPLSLTVIAITAVAAVFMRGSGETLGVSLVQLMMNDVEGVSNMEVWLNDEVVTFDWPLYLDKVGEGLMRFIAPNFSQVFFGPATILALLYLWGLVRLWRRRRALDARSRNIALMHFAMGLICFAIFGAIVILHQNQFRYLVYLLPILLVANTHFYQAELRAVLDRWWLFTAGILTLLGLNGLLATYLRGESIVEGREVALMREGLAQNEALADARRVFDCYDGRRSLQLAYAAQDKQIVHVSVDHLDRQYKELARLSGADLLLCPASTDLSRLQNVDPQLIDERPFKGEVFKGMRLYRLTPRP